ncbi:hypothetical protein F511_02134 [Dorcoceras hygrometricum]|nr:hypothetical protein F511_02134 [Dorcoceras hygrometricum]
MSNVEQEADNSKRNSEESDVVLKNQQMVRVQQMATMEWIQQKRKDKDCKTTALDLRETTASSTYKEPVGTSSKNDQQAATVQPVEGTQRSVARKWKEDDELALTSAEEIWNSSNGYIRTECIYRRRFEGRRSTSVKRRRLLIERRNKNRGKIPGDEAADRH